MNWLKKQIMREQKGYYINTAGHPLTTNSTALQACGGDEALRRETTVILSDHQTHPIAQITLMAPSLEIKGVARSAVHGLRRMAVFHFANRGDLLSSCPMRKRCAEIWAQGTGQMCGRVDHAAGTLRRLCLWGDKPQ